MNQPDFFTRFFGVALRGQTYLNLLYLLLAFPLGLLYFIFLVTGLAVGFSLLIIWIGLVILLAVMGAWVLFARFERELANGLLRENIPPMQAAAATKPGILEQIRAHTANPATWKGLAYLLAKFPIGIFSFVMITVLLAVTGAFLSAPFVIQYQPIWVFVTDNSPGLIIDTPAEGSVAFVIGLALFLVSLHLLNGLAWLSGRFARIMLGDPRQAALSQPAATAPSSPGAPAADGAHAVDKEKTNMKNRSNLALALTLIGIGGWFLAIEIFPQIKEFAYNNEFSWPIPIIGIGALLAVIGLVTWTPDMLIPASIVAGIGGLLFWQNSTGNWGTWAFAWALIPGFVGVGVVLSGLMQWNRKVMVGGFWTILNSLILFAIFGAFLGGYTDWWRYWPVLIIAAGVLMLVQGVFRRK